jgi:hypothetical protein
MLEDWDEACRELETSGSKYGQALKRKIGIPCSGPGSTPSGQVEQDTTREIADNNSSIKSATAGLSAIDEIFGGETDDEQSHSEKLDAGHDLSEFSGGTPPINAGTLEDPKPNRDPSEENKHTQGTGSEVFPTTQSRAKSETYVDPFGDYGYAGQPRSRRYFQDRQ